MECERSQDRFWIVVLLLCFCTTVLLTMYVHLSLVFRGKRKRGEERRKRREEKKGREGEERKGM